MKYTRLFLDTETTGNEESDRLCQVAYSISGARHEALFTPPVPISIESMAVHHITPKMVVGKPAFTESEEFQTLEKLFADPSIVFIAHNASFDVGMLEKEGLKPGKVICTLRLARYLDKEALIPRYNLQYLRYFLGMEVEANAHDALGDVLVLEELFKRLEKKIVEEVGGDIDKAYEMMFEISTRPSLLHTFTFGKHNGKKVADVAKLDRGYLEWMLTEKSKDPTNEEDWIYTLKHYLGR